MDGTGTGTGTLPVPLDGSRLAERALHYALGLAEATGARVLLLHVVPDVGLRPQAELDLATRAREVRHGAPSAPVETTVGSGDPARAIGRGRGPPGRPDRDDHSRALGPGALAVRQRRGRRAAPRAGAASRSLTRR